MTATTRLDELLVARGLAPNLRRAQALIRAGRVLAPGRRLDKPGHRLPTDAELDLVPDRAYVSRGGTKLAAALARWPVDPQGCVCLDVGASAGGFSDCLLQHGAARVYAVDVGYGQLDERLRRDARVVAMERTDARDLAGLAFDPPPELATVDVSFISLRAILPAVAASLPVASDVLALVKPQFEAEKLAVGHDGVVRDPATRAAAVGHVAAWAVGQSWRVGGVLRSPVRGPKGNVECWLWLRTPAARVEADP